MANNFPNIEEYVGQLETLASNAHYDLDIHSEYPNIVLRPNGTGTYPKNQMPTIYGYYDEDDDQFWFEPKMEFPKYLEDVSFSGGYYSRLEDWAKAAKLADYLLDTSWYIESED